jgi:hypothetical protein
MAEGEGDEEKGFKVEDRRRFSPETGEARPDAESRKPAQEKPEAQTVREQPRERKPAEAALSEINFSTFVISLSTQALVHLGEVANPVSGQVERDLPVAKQMIDILALLKDKTRGNLDQNEGKLIEEILYDLRIRYVEAVKKH